MPASQARRVVCLHDIRDADSSRLGAFYPEENEGVGRGEGARESYFRLEIFSREFYYSRRMPAERLLFTVKAEYRVDRARRKKKIT